MLTFPIVEIFQSLQGEGYNTGMPAIFIRFGGCNLCCPWCDTHFDHFQKFTLTAILTRVLTYSAENIIITGGEPTLQKYLFELVVRLKRFGYYIAIETNGLRTVCTGIDYIAVSPKYHYWQNYHDAPLIKADEVRIVVEDAEDIEQFCLEMEQRIKAKHYYLSPCEQNGDTTLLPTLQLLGKLNRNRQDNKWQLSIQAHKIANIE